MKNWVFFFLAFLSIPCLFGQPIETSGDNSPAVIAQNFSATYGVRADAVEAILWIFEAEGYDMGRRKRATEQIIKEYAQSPEKQQNTDVLSEATRSKINNPEIANALEWDLFTHRHYLSTSGHNSPSVVAKGDVNIWYGIPPKTLRALAEGLEKNKTYLTNFETQLAEQVKKYEELSQSLLNREDEMAKEAKLFLEEGEIDEAVKVLGDRRYALKKQRERAEKREAEAAYDYAEGLSLQLKYDSAAVEFRAAVDLYPENSTYHLHYANNESTLAHYGQAIRHYEIALGIDSLKRDNEERIATLINNLGGVWFSNGEYDKAIGYYEKALTIGLKALGENHPKVATNYNNLGSVWNSNGEYDKAIGYHEQALQICLKTLGDQHQDVAVTYNNLGGAWTEKGEYDKAIGYFEQALQIFSKALGDQHPNLAMSYDNLGGAWTGKGEYNKAIGYFEQALQIRLKVLGDQHPSVALTYNNLGGAWYSKGEYDKAIGYYEQALQIFLKALGDQHPYVALTYNNLGSAWTPKGEYDKAIGYFEQALQIRLKAFGDQHPEVATNYNNLGAAWASKGDHYKAIGYFEQALQIRLKALGDQHPDVAMTYSNLGGAWTEKGEYDKAIAFSEKALGIASVAFGNKHPTVATVYNNLGLAWGDKGEYDRAITFFEKALGIDSVAFSNKHPSVARSYNNLGHAWAAKGEYDRAITFFEKELGILSPVLGLNHPYTKEATQNLAKAALDCGMEFFEEKQYASALPYFQKALENAEVGDDLSFSLICLNNIGCSNKNLRNYTEGLSALGKGIARGEELARTIDEQFKTYSAEQLKSPKAQAQIAELKNTALIRRMHYHKVGCLKGLKKNKEADDLAKQLWKEGIEANDARLLKDLQKEGYDFGKN